MAWNEEKRHEWDKYRKHEGANAYFRLMLVEWS